MRLTDKEKNDRRQARIKELGLVKLTQPITVDQREKFKSVLRGEAKIVKTNASDFNLQVQAKKAKDSIANWPEWRKKAVADSIAYECNLKTENSTD